MKKKYIIFIIIFVLIISIVIITNDNKYLNLKGYPNTLIMVTYNGKEQDSFPVKDNSLYYDIDVTCSNAEGSWDYENWKLLIQNLDTTAKCRVDITSSSKDTLYNKIVSDWNKIDGTNNIYKEIHTLTNNETYYEYRYEGKDTEVNNYVWFNNELWRIIGAFPGGTPSTLNSDGSLNIGNASPSVNNTVKIIRNDTIGGFVWDKDNTNNWNNAELNTNILNNLYLNSLSGTCNYYSTTISKKCNFERIGLKNVEDYLTEVTWNLGGCSSDELYTSSMYTYERGSQVYTGNPYLTVTKVGLMYPSDYGYANPEEDCQNNTKLNLYFNSCTINNWLFKYSYEYLQTPFSNNTNTLRIYNWGQVLNASPIGSYLVRPVVYLNNNVYVYGGDGSINNPFYVSL